MLAISPRRWPLRRRRKTASRCTRAHRPTATNRSAASSSRRISSREGVRERGGGIGGRARSAVTTVVTWPARFAQVRSRVIAPKTLRRFFAGVAARTASTSSRGRVGNRAVAMTLDEPSQPCERCSHAARCCWPAGLGAVKALHLGQEGFRPPFDTVVRLASARLSESSFCAHSAPLPVKIAPFASCCDDQPGTLSGLFRRKAS